MPSMKASTTSALLSALALSATGVVAVPDVDTTYPYTGPAVPIGDWVDQTINGNGKGFPRLVEAPAVAPGSSNPTNNINVISLSYLPNGINVHYQTPFGLGVAPSVNWGTSASNLNQQAAGVTHTYDRTPPCSLVVVTQCSQFFHEVQITGLQADTTYYYQIPSANGTTASDVLTFTTGRSAGNPTEFTVAVLNDMGYTNAQGTYQQLINAIDTEGVAFAWHGGDISYADDWYSGILPCESDWPVCYNGTSSELPGPITPAYEAPLPAGEIANQGGPQGGDMSVLYESNWDLWQQWMQNITSKVPYMVLPGNHEASCSEFDGPGNVLTAYLNNNQTNSTAPESALTYYSCPPSQRNFTAYQNRFRMPGSESGGVGNFWYSFDYGLAHFVSIDGETDFAKSPEYPFAADLSGDETHPTESETYVTDSGPFGAIDGSYKDTVNYEQYQWLAKDLASVDRTKTPWVIAMSHRPMYSSGVSSYQANLRAAFQDLLLQNGVDMYLSGHIHWYERLFPLGVNGTIDTESIVNNNTYYTNPGKSMTHIINGMAGNIESHSTLSATETILNITVVLDQVHYGFSKLTVHNCSALTWQFVHGDDGSIGDELTLLKHSNGSCGASSSAGGVSSTSTSTSKSIGSCTASVASSKSGTIFMTTTSTATSAATATASSSSGSGLPSGVTVTTEVVTAYTTYCPVATTITQGSQTYTVTEATTLTITNCPCTMTYTVTSSTPAPQSSSAASSVVSQGTSAFSSSSTAAEGTPIVPVAPQSSVAASSIAPEPTATMVVSPVVASSAASQVVPTSPLALQSASTSAVVNSAGSAGPTPASPTTPPAGESATSSGSSVSNTPETFTGAANQAVPARFAALAVMVGFFIMFL